MKHLLPILALCVFSGVCTSEKDATELLLFVTASDTSAAAGEIVYFDIEARSLDSRIDTVSVRTYDKENGPLPLFSDRPRTERYTHRLYWSVPATARDSLDVELTFRATDPAGQSRERHIAFLVRGSAAPLRELSGITLYAPASGNPDGFSLTTRQPVRTATAAPGEVDFYLYADPEAPEDALPRQWRTRTDIRFAKVNRFDFAAATDRSLRAVYDASVRTDYVDDLTADDIILIGREAPLGADSVAAGDTSARAGAWGVVKIMQAYDEPGSSNDRYLLHIKYID